MNADRVQARRLTRAVATMAKSRTDRDDAVIALHRNGWTVSEIAELAGMTRQRIYQIVRAA